jgi:hypothetical protein
MSNPLSAREQLERLEQLVPLCTSIRKGTEYASALAQAGGEVLKAAALPGRLESLEPALSLLGGTEQLSAEEIKPDLDKLEVAGHHLEQCVSTEALKEARFWVKDIREALERVEVVATKAWAARVHAEFGPLQRLGTVLAEIPDTETAGAALKKWAARALSVSGQSTPTVESVNDFKAAQAEVADRLEALGKLGIDAAVRTFLLEVAGEKATLASVTPGVLEWLRAKDAHARFRIELS